MSSLAALVSFGAPHRTDDENGNAFFKLVHETAKAYDREARAIRSDSKLSPEGRREKLAELAQRYDKEIEAFANGDLPTAVAKREQELRTRARQYAPAAPKDPVAEIRAQEIRDALRAMEESERIKTVGTAVEAGDADIYSAVTHDPLRAIRPIIPERFASEFAKAWLSRHDSGLGEAISHLHDLHKIMVHVGNDLRREIAADAGLAPDLSARIDAA